MRTRDLLSLTSSALKAQQMRSALTALGIAVGIAAVILLTSIGEGIHQFVLAEFSQFGTNVISVAPGKTKTRGTSIGIFGSDRPLTIDDAQALKRVPNVVYSDPALQGNAEISVGGRARRVTVYGVGPDFDKALHINVSVGRFLPPDEASAARAFVALGAKVRRELFANGNPLGSRVDIGGSRFRVIGVMEAKGEILGVNLDDAVYIPASRALELFNRDGLMEIHVVHAPGVAVDSVVEDIRGVLRARHGREDFTITPQQQMLDVLSSILGVLTFAVGALGGISLLVGGVGILTIMTISVAERTAEIGLLKALGARRGQILALFLGEAILLSALGGALGLLAGIGIAQALRVAFSALPVHTPWSYVLAAELVAIAIGVAAGVAPAARAAKMDPVESLRTE